MPIYEYQCRVCGAIRELYYKCSEDAPGNSILICPNTRQLSGFKRIISCSNFHLRGPGWSRDNYEDRPWGKKDYHKAVKEDGYIPGSYVKTGKGRFKKTK